MVPAASPSLSRDAPTASMRGRSRPHGLDRDLPDPSAQGAASDGPGHLPPSRGGGLPGATLVSNAPSRRRMSPRLPTASAGPDRGAPEPRARFRRLSAGDPGLASPRGSRPDRLLLLNDSIWVSRPAATATWLDRLESARRRPRRSGAHLRAPPNPMGARILQSYWTSCFPPAQCRREARLSRVLRGLCHVEQQESARSARQMRADAGVPRGWSERSRRSMTPMRR